MPRALVTGAAGFIGSHLCEYLLDRGFTVVGMDNLLTGDLANVEHLSGREFVFIRHDVTNYINLEGPLDWIFHFASPASPIDYLRVPIQTLKVGSLGTHNGLGLAKAKRARFLLASTSEVYGDPKVHPQREDYWGNVNPVGPRGVYDEAKRYAEALTMAYHRQQGVDTAMVRGARQDPVTKLMEDRSPKFFRKEITPAEAGEALAQGITQRAARTIRPKRWSIWFRSRGLVNPRLDELMIRDDSIQAGIAAAEAVKRSESIAS